MPELVIKHRAAKEAAQRLLPAAPFGDIEDVGNMPQLLGLLVRAFTRCGCAWPKPFTAMPAEIKKALARMRIRYAPSPRSKERSAGYKGITGVIMPLSGLKLDPE